MAEGGADLLQAAEGAETEQQSALEAAPVEQAYQETLALYVHGKRDQVEHLEDRLENLIDRQRAQLQQTLGAAPGLLALPGSKKAWQSKQAKQQARLLALHGRLDAVREIKEGMGLHSPRIEELATRKMRADNPNLASDWDAMRELSRRYGALIRQQKQGHEREPLPNPERQGRARTILVGPGST